MKTSGEPPAAQVRQSELAPTSNLQTSLHAATRSKHTNLNKTITNRLPLCLPPHATTPLGYHLGMLAFGMIYQQLERGTEAVRKEQSTNSSLDQDRLRYVSILERLYTEGLGRTQYLKMDTQTMHERLLRTRQFSAEVLEEMEETVRRYSEAGTVQIYERIQDKPYLALAYAWAMYLALFNGGRWLLKQLESAGTDFWLENSEQESLQRSIAALSFWRFEAATTEDPNADQLKTTFKQNFDSASLMLTEEEAAEVVQEGIAVFDTCSGLIEMLDSCVQQMETRSRPPQSPSKMAGDEKEESVSPVWQTLESIVLTPAYQIMRRIWTQSPRSDVTIAAG